MKRYAIDTENVAIHDTLTDEYAPYITIGRATEDAGYLNEGIAQKDDLNWMNGELFRLAVLYDDAD